MTRTLVLAIRLIALGGIAVNAAPASAEAFVTVGATGARIEANIANVPERYENTESGLHLGFGVRRSLERGDFGVRVELDDLDDSFLAVRAIDYRFHVSERLAVGAFFGAAKLDLATPAYGYYLGAGVHFRRLLEKFELGIEYRYGDDVARDVLLPSDPQGPQPDSFYDVSAFSISLSYRF
jgi:hypothetical protein